MKEIIIACFLFLVSIGALVMSIRSLMWLMEKLLGRKPWAQFVSMLVGLRRRSSRSYCHRSYLKAFRCPK